MGVKDIKEVAKLGAERWKALSAEDKKPYEEAYAEKMKVYEEAKKNYVPQPVAENRSDEGANSAGLVPHKKSRGVKTRKAHALSPAADTVPVAARASKRSRIAKTGKDEFDDASIDAGVLAEAKDCGFENALKTLASRNEIIAKKTSFRQMLDALKQSAGLVNKAKDAILAM